MSDDRPFLDQLGDFADEFAPKIIEQMREIIEQGGVKTVREKCAHCSRMNTYEVDVADPKQLREIMDSLRLALAEQAKQRAASGDNATARAARILKAREEMTDLELAEEIARVEDELGV